MRIFVCTLLACALLGCAYAELQNVEVFGRIDVRYRYYRGAFNTATVPGGGPGREVRIPQAFLPRRATGDPLGVSSIFSFDRNRPEWKFTELVTTLGVKADFTNNVNALIEYYAFDRYGTDFRSDYITGADFAGGGDVGILQSYIEMNEIGGLPLRARIGRQRMRFDDGWLISDRATPTLRISWDGVLLTYATDEFEVDAFATKLFESGPFQKDGDIDFYGIRAAYKALEPVDLALWWYWVRDGRRFNDTNLNWINEWFEDLLGLDDYGTTNLHTVGGRAWGRSGALDYDLKLAYQFGEADALGSRFRIGSYGDHRARWGQWAGELEIGYTFDVAWRFRPYVLGVYMGGEDNRDISFREWMNPFHRPKASVSFNRLFSETNYAPACNDNAWMTNFTHLAAGATFTPLEKVSVKTQLGYFRAIETFDWPAYFRVGRQRFLVAPELSWWTTSSGKGIGWEWMNILRYAYSDNLSIILYYSRFFADTAHTRDGHYVYFNGTDFSGGSANDDVDYFFLWFIVTF